MSDLTSLTNSFQSMVVGPKQANYHELRLEYPVLDLLPVDQAVTPTLRPPAFAGWREKPNPTKYHLPLTGTDFVVRLPLSNEPRSTFPALDFQDVFATFASSLSRAGRSVLQIVSYSDPENGETYRFSLLSGSQDQDQLEIVAESELSSIIWEAERLVRQHKPWMKLIWHLTRRLSDRAYFHVHERLKTYRWYLKQSAEERWDRKPPFDAKRFLASQLLVVLYPDLNGDYARAMREHDLEGESERTFMFPCGHEQSYEVHRLRRMTVAKCLHFCCMFCGARVASQDNGWRLWLWLHRQRERREKFAAQEAVWSHLEKVYRVGSQKVNVDSTVLHKALQHAMASIIPPETAAPLALHEVNSAPLAEAMSGFWGQLQGEYTITQSSACILNGLVEKFDRAVGRVEGSGRESGSLQCLSPAGRTLASLWLERATLLAGISGYDGREPNLLFDGDGFEEEEDVHDSGAEMDDLEEMMREARLE